MESPSKFQLKCLFQIVQIGRILNAHMNSLQWIDQNTALIATHLEQVSKLHDVHRRENERSFHLTYDWKPSDLFCCAVWGNVENILKWTQGCGTKFLTTWKLYYLCMQLMIKFVSTNEMLSEVSFSLKCHIP